MRSWLFFRFIDDHCDVQVSPQPGRLPRASVIESVFANDVVRYSRQPDRSNRLGFRNVGPRGAQFDLKQATGFETL